MSNSEEYSNNIDDQLLSVAKQAEGVVVDTGASHQDLDAGAKLEHIAHAAAFSERDGKSRDLQDGRHQQHPLHALHAQFLQDSKDYDLANGALHYNQQDMDESEYNIQIPDPIIDSKSKIYPVSGNTITADGNLITRPYPEQVFQNREALNDFIQDFARDNGFGVVIAHSNRKAIYYTCELGGRYRHKKSKKDLDPTDNYHLDQAAKTKKLKCPFAMTASFKKSTGVWTLRTTCNEHNHPQLDPLSNHPMLRKRSDELNLLILDLYKVGSKPSHIESKIKDQYPEVLIKREDIYNEIRGYKRKLKKQNRFLTNALRGMKKRNATSFHQVLDDDDAQRNDDVLEFELQQQHQHDAELQRQLRQATGASHHHHQLDHHQYQQYQHQLQDHGIHSDGSAAAAIAAVANATHRPDSHDLSMDNIDSRLVGE